MSVKGIRAEKAYVELFTDPKQFSAGLSRASKDLQRFADGAVRVGRQMAMAGTAILTPFVVSTKTFAAFESEMAFVKSVTNATAAEFAALTERAELLGRTTSFTLTQVAQGMTELGRAGMSPDEILDSMNAVLGLARATRVDLATAANTAAASLRTFGLDASQFGSVADIMVATANGSMQSMEDLAESFKYAALLSNQFGMSLSGTMKALGVMANVGLKGSIAGTNLRGVLIRLGSPATQKKLRMLGEGIETLTPSGGMRDLVSIMSELGREMDRLPSGKRLAAVKEMFGQRAAPGALALMDTAGTDRMNAAFEDVAGAATRASTTIDNTLMGTLLRLWSATEAARNAVGEIMAPAVEAIAIKVKDVTTVFIAWSEKNKDLLRGIALLGAGLVVGGTALAALGVTVGLVAGAIGGLAVACVTTAMAVGPVVGAFKALGAVIAAVFSPVGLLIAGIAISVYAVWRAFETFRNVVKAVGRAIVDLGQWIGRALKPAFDWLWGAITKIGKGIWEYLVGMFTKAFTWLGSVVAKWSKTVADKFAEGIAAARKEAKEMFDDPVSKKRGISDPLGQTSQTEETLIRRNHQLKIDAIEDAKRRELETIRLKYYYEKKRMEDSAESARAHAARESAQKLEYMAVEAKYAGQLRKEEAAAKAKADSLNHRNQLALSRARIEATLTGEKRSRALLELDRREALQEGADVGANLSLIKARYDLLAKLAGQQSHLQSLAGRGTFSGAEASRWGQRASDRDMIALSRDNAKSNKASAAYLKRVAEWKSNILVFG